MNFATPCDLPKKEFRKPYETENEFRNSLRNFRNPCETKAEENQFRNPLRNFCKPCEIFL